MEENPVLKKSYFIDDKSKKITTLTKNNLFICEDKFDKLKYQIIAQVLLNQTENWKKEELILNSYQLYDVDYSALVRKEKNYILFQIKITFLNNRDSYFSEKINQFIEEIFSKHKIIDKDLQVAINDMDKYYEILEDDASLRSKQYFTDAVLFLDDNHLKFEEVQKFLKTLTSEQLRVKIEKLNKLQNNFYIYKTNQKNKENVEKIIKQLEIEDEISQEIKAVNLQYSNQKLFLEELKKEKSTDQVIIQMTLEVKNELNKWVLILINELFGASPSSVLFRVVREQKNLCYSIYTQAIRDFGLKIVLETDQKNIELANKTIKECWNGLSQTVNEEMLEQFKKQIISRYQKNNSKYQLNENLIINSLINGQRVETVAGIVKSLKKISLEEVRTGIKELEFKKVIISN